MAVVELIFKGTDEASGAVRQVRQDLSDVGGAADQAKEKGGGFFSSMLGAASGFLAANVIGGITSQFGGLVKGMIDGNAEFENYQTQFGVLLGSADAAKQRLDDLAKFGASTPFDLPELVKADKVLTAFGLDTADTAKKFGVSAAQIRTTIGDAASGAGVSFEELANTFGKFASGSTGDAIARLQELGIATKEQMASWGLEFSKSGQLLTPANEAFTVLEQHVREKYGGMMDAQSKTFDGMLSNLDDWKGQTLRMIGQPIFDVLKDKLGDLLTFLGSDEVKGAMDSFAHGLADGIGKAMDFLTNDAIPALVAGWNTISPAVGTVIDVVRQVVGAFSGSGAGADALASKVKDLQGIWDALKPAIDNTVNTVKGLVLQVFGVVQTFLQQHGDDIKATMNDAWTRIMEIVKLGIELYNAVVPPILQAVAGFIASHGQEIQAVLSAAWAIIKATIDTTLTVIKGIITVALDLIHGDWGKAWSDIQKTVSDVWDGIKKGISDAIANLRPVISEIVQWIKDRWQDLVNGAAGIGQNIIDGIIRGVQNGVGALKDAVTGAAKSALDAAKKALGIASPSKAAAEEIGSPFVQGVVQGLLDALPQLRAAVGEVKSNLLSDLSDIIKQGQSMYGAMAGLARGESGALRDAAGLFASGNAARQAQDDQDKAMQRLNDLNAQYVQTQVTAQQNIDPAKREEAAKKLLDIEKQRGAAASAVIEAHQRLVTAQQQDAQQNAIAAAAKQQIDAARAEADKLQKTDPERAQALFNLKVKQIMELAKLQQDQAAATSDDERARIADQIALIKQAQAADLKQFRLASVPLTGTPAPADDTTKGKNKTTTGGSAGSSGGSRSSGGTSVTFAEKSIVIIIGAAAGAAQIQQGVQQGILEALRQAGLNADARARVGG